MGRPNLSCETKFSGANGDREIFILSFQLTTSRFGNLTRLIRSPMTIHKYILYLYIQQYRCVCVFSSHSFWTSSSLDVPAGVTQEFSSTFLLRCVA